MKPPVKVVLRHVRDTKEANWEGGFAYETIARETGCTEDEAYEAMEEAEDLRYIDCGVSLRTGWLTDLGMLVLEEP